MLSAVLLLSCAQVQEKPDFKKLFEAEMTLASLGAEGYHTLKSPDSISVVRVERNHNRRKLIQGILVEFGERRVISGEVFKTLRKAYVDKTLVKTGLLLCGFMPEYMLVYKKKDYEVNAVICFSCNQTMLLGTNLAGYAAPPFHREMLSQLVPLEDRTEAALYRALGDVAVYPSLRKGDFQVESMVTNAHSRTDQHKLKTPSYDSVKNLLDEIPRAIRQRVESAEMKEAPVAPSWGKQWLAIQFSSKYRPRIVIAPDYLIIEDGHHSGGVSLTPKMISIVNEMYGDDKQ